MNENARISIKFSLKFVPKGPINNIPALVQIVGWRRPGDKPLSEPGMVSLLTHICVTRPQWVKLWMSIKIRQKTKDKKLFLIDVVISDKTCCWNRPGLPPNFGFLSLDKHIHYPLILVITHVSTHFPQLISDFYIGKVPFVIVCIYISRVNSESEKIDVPQPFWWTWPMQRAQVKLLLFLRCDNWVRMVDKANNCDNDLTIVIA